MLKPYKMNPIDSGPTKIIRIGLEAFSKIFLRFLKGPEKGKSKFQKFVETRVFKKPKSIYSSISRQNIDAGIK